MLNKLKELLASTSQEEVDKDWKEIEDLNMDSPTFDEYLEFLEQQRRLND